jgi:hypothetical protein
VRRAVADLRILLSCLNESTFEVSSYSDVMGLDRALSLLFLLLWCILRTESYLVERCGKAASLCTLKASSQVFLSGTFHALDTSSRFTMPHTSAHFCCVSQSNGVENLGRTARAFEGLMS